MTAPTPKPDQPKTGGKSRPAVLLASACLVFAIFALALIRVLPAPHGRADYLIVGTLATLAALITIFAGLVLGNRRR